MAYRSSKHETTGVIPPHSTPAESYFARDLRLPMDLLRSPSEFEFLFIWGLRQWFGKETWGNSL